MELRHILLHNSQKERENGRHIRWTYAMDECMIQVFLEEARLGHKGKTCFEDKAYTTVINALAERLDTDICKKHIAHRLKSFRKEYRMFRTLIQQNGFVWDSARNKVTAEDSTWNDFIKVNPKFKSFRGRPCKWKFESLDIIVGKTRVLECSSMDSHDSDETDTEIDSREKGKQVRWTFEMDKCMIATLVEQARLGLKGEKGFKDKAYSAVFRALAHEVGIDVCKSHVDNRLRTLRTEYHVFYTLREHIEFCWDPVRNKVTAPDSIWNDYLKEHPEFKSYRGRACKWDYESLAIIVGNNQAVGSNARSCLDSSQSTPEVDSNGKGKQLRWTREMDKCMIETIVNHVKPGNKGNQRFEYQVYDAVREALADQLHLDVEQNGFSWDSRKNTVTASDATWNEFIKEHPKFRHCRGRACKWDYESLAIIVDNMEKGTQVRWTQDMDECMIETLIKQAHPKFKHYRGRACKWDYDSLAIIVGNYDTAQSIGISSPNVVDVDMASCPVQDVDVTYDLALQANMRHGDCDEEEERLSQDFKRNLSPRTPYSRHEKKARTADIVREVMDMVNEKIGGMTKLVDGLSFAKELYTEVMKVEGFSPDFLDRAFEILKRDGHGAEIFLVRTEPYRKRMLKELYEKYGEHGENGSVA
ncbi:hypothetical protein IFM89_027233 [Coptis chinensis]|uniref:Myb/SANT-like domain-containing protein n=1 Tax=Coptis chinensis TaxID=261450 RepID=A0A835LKL9_9MAGN|nr:hypothetical protein IFM89_027233 [Coptis chinensis]